MVNIAHSYLAKFANSSLAVTTGSLILPEFEFDYNNGCNFEPFVLQ